jgi:hypothetical protein
MVRVKVGEASCRGGYDPQRGEYYIYYETIAGGPGSRPGLPGGSCTSILRVIPPPPKPGTMLPYHTNMRGACHDFAPCILPTRHSGIPVALHHVAWRLA